MNMEELNGRYTYEVGNPQHIWTKVNKIPQCRESLDMMSSEKLFRLGINQEKETEVDPQTLQKL